MTLLTQALVALMMQPPLSFVAMVKVTATSFMGLELLPSVTLAVMMEDWPSATVAGDATKEDMFAPVRLPVFLITIDADIPLSRVA